mmetsp:Transcript_56224/g.149761  ORF Transcript_56224/g.149761 Transcript_56224/m.149761 type:complete len:138 (-) Transcript_56224:101-514(-)
MKSRKPTHSTMTTTTAPGTNHRSSHAKQCDVLSRSASLLWDGGSQGPMCGLAARNGPVQSQEPGSDLADIGLRGCRHESASRQTMTQSEPRDSIKDCSGNRQIRARHPVSDRFDLRLSAAGSTDLSAKKPTHSGPEQ